MEGPDQKISVNIVATYSDKIANEIMKEFGKGVTIIEGKGGFSGDAKDIIFCTINPYQTPRLKSIVLDADPTAFVTINEGVSVIGGGFKNKSLEH
jgi:uncharacterized membrane-anchored protein YitT (DUF2179 family)